MIGLVLWKKYMVDFCKKTLDNIILLLKYQEIASQKHLALHVWP